MKRLVIHTVLALALVAGVNRATSQGTLFNYQGQLSIGGAPANGSYDMVFKLFDALTAGNQVGPTLTNSAVTVSNGFFATTLDFGAVFDGTTLWLHIGVRTNGVGLFTPLTPRQELLPVPYAITAENLDGTLPASQLTGTLPAGLLSGAYGSAVTLNNAGNNFSGNGAWLQNVNALTLDGLGPTNFWNTAGNAGTTPGVNFLGTTDNEALELDANGLRGLHLEYTSRSSSFPILFRQAGMNVVGGFWGNTISSGVIGGTIAGGGDQAGALFPLTPYPNAVTNDFGTVGGGYANTAGLAATIPGGYENLATGSGSFAAGRYAHTANAGSFIWGDGTISPFNSTGPNCFDVLASGGVYFYNGDGGVNIDYRNQNTNTIDYGLRFGVGSGEGIGSKRDAGPNQYGLDFYTAFANRMTIQNDGSMRVYDNNIYLRGDTDGNHGLAYRNTVVGIFFDGPFLWGYNGGALGTVGPDEISLKWDYTGNVWISNNCSVASLTIRGGADLAEPFEISSSGQGEAVAPGSVVVIDEDCPGHLKLSERAYDTRVAGVVSGANGVNAGIQMQQQGLLEGGQNVALTGRVYVQADASYGSIRPRDLLTTSNTPGHAMKVLDHSRAQGAILGKAMTGLKEGKGTVLVLVTLQ